MITTLEYCSLWDRPPNVGGAVNYGYFADCVGDVRWSERLDNNEECVLQVPASSRGAAARAQQVLVLHFAPPSPGTLGDTRVFRITAVTQAASEGGILVTLQARSLVLDLTNAGRMRDVLAGGRQEYAIAGTLTGSAWWTTYALPQLARAGYDYLASALYGATLIPLAFENWTPGQLVQQLHEFLGLEWTLNPLGATWVIEHAEQLNVALTPLRIEAGNALRRLERTRGSIDQATILDPVGRGGHSTLTQSIQHHAAQGSNFNTATDTFDIAPLVSDLGFSYRVVQLSGQWVGLYVQRVSTGRCFLVTGSVAPTPSSSLQQVTVDDLTDWSFDPDDDVFEFRASREESPSLFVPTPGLPVRVTSSTFSNPVSIDNPFSAADPSTINDQHRDLRAVNSFNVLATTCTAIANVAGSNEQDLTLASTAGLFVGTGIWGFLHTNVAVPWAIYGRPFTITQIISPTVVRVAMRYPFESGRPLTVAAGTRQARFYQPRSNPSYVNAENAAANQLTLSDPLNYSNQDLIEYAVDSGALVGGLPAPSAAAIDAGGYGVVAKVAEFPRARAIRNLLHAGNPWFDVWSGGAGSAPDLWSVVNPYGGTGTPSKVTTNLPGPGTVHAIGLTGATLPGVQSPKFFARPTAGDSKVCVRVRLRTGVGAGWSSATGARVIIEVIPAGGTTVLGTVSVCASNFPSPPATHQIVDPDTVVDVDLLAVDVLHLAAVGAPWAPWQGLQVRITAFGTGSDCTIGGVFVVQDETLPPAPEMLKTSDYTLVGLGQIRLDTIDQPIETIDADAVDLSRLLVDAYGTAALVKGRRVEVSYEPLGLVVTDRISALEFRAAVGGETRVTVQTRTRDLADILAEQLSSTSST